MVNLIATIPGARKERIAIAGHYDTKLFREFRFVGANDGGSSTAFLIELARVLKARANAFTIELIFFDGEEATLRDWGGTDHTYGSQYYVDTARKAGTLVGAEGARAGRHDRRALAALPARVQLDAVAHRHHLVDRAEDGPRLDLRQRRARRSRTTTCPFLNAGVPATDIIDLDYAAWHTPPTRSIRRRRGACRSSGMWCSRRSPRSKLACEQETRI